MKLDVKFWIKVALINLLIVAVLGALMRYKIGFSFPYLTQKNLQNAHSHFAFTGWITHAIYVLLIYFVANNALRYHLKQYKRVLMINLAGAYGVLISFFLSGYSVVSIVLLTLMIVNNGFLTYYLFRDFKKMETHPPSVAWFKSAMWFNLVSSIGTFYLAYMMVSRNFNEHWYLASVYFYLHFQYNGFFTFACMGLALDRLPEVLPAYNYDRRVFVLFFTSCIPAYFLSTLWANLPVWLYILVVVSAFVQLIAWGMFIRDIRRALSGGTTLSSYTKFLFVFIAMAFTVKLLLQLGSTIPEISKLAFGFRPVVIAYLHLVLLAIISVFLLAYFFAVRLIQTHRKSINALTVFLAGVFFNELALAVQGIASFSYVPIRQINTLLFIIALGIVLGVLLILLSQKQRGLKEHPKE